MQRFIPILAVVVLSGCAHSVWFDAVDCEAGPCGREDARDAKRAIEPPPVEGVEDTGSAVEEEDSASREDTAPAADTRPTDPTGDPCMDCASTKCSTEISGCFAEANCKALNDCFGTCTDETCASDCYAKYPSPAYDRFVSCAMTKCATECS